MCLYAPPRAFERIIYPESDEPPDPPPADTAKRREVATP
jgi:hypothetical protein